MTRSTVPTRREFVDSLEREFGAFDLDPCALPENAKAPRFFTPLDNGLAQDWFGRVFCNPPYDRGIIGQWVRKAGHEVTMGRAELVVLLIPAATSTEWWHAAVEGQATEIRFLQGRGRYFDHPAGPSAFRPRFEPCLVIFGHVAAAKGWRPQQCVSAL